MKPTNFRLLAAIMFTDMVGYTLMMQENEQKAKEIRDRQRKALEELVPRHRGRILQYYGDGTLSIFNSAIEAAKCAIEVQHELQTEPKVPMRIGLHTADIAYDDEGVYGDGVNIASRIQALSVPGAILISDKVYDEIKNQSFFNAVSLGEVELKHVKRPVEIYALAGEGLTVPTPEQIKSRKPPAYRSVAVLPFVNMSTDPENEYFSDGISEELLNALSQVEGLRVTSRTSSFVFKGKNQDIREIGQKLNVSSVLEGSVRKAGDRVRITAQLINTVDGYHIWSETFDRKLSDIFAIQDEISRNIAEALREKLAPGTTKDHLVKPRTTNIEAYNLYLKSKYYWNKWTPDNHRKSIGVLEEAIRIDPDFSLAYSGLAACYVVLGTTGQMSPKKSYPKAKEYAQKALALDADLMESHLSLATVKLFFDWNFEGAERSFQKALELNPGSAEVHHIYGIHLSLMGKKEEAISELEKARSLDPLSLPINDYLGVVYSVGGRFEDAEKVFLKNLELEPSFRSSKNNLAWLYLVNGETEKAIEMFEQTRRETGDELKGTTLLGVAYAKGGRLEEARKCLDILYQRQQRDVDASLTLDLALLHLTLNDLDKAFDYVEAAYEERLGGLLFVRINPIWQDVHSHPRFLALMKKMGFE
ncbi:MAG: tetratricopeptide repeat protein [Ignavibacteriae bacterium]|nr:tetratricopeptide repeat protein [Ignavibacteriota bacterium]